ncbi:hypothetical protein [Microvirga sp. BSC39]|uniref:hypothetical protein n=1 Tax=Microvirga sp. BSC39 TaxID=1549810 RepID=UPI000B325D8B|nr:hypothetical protein [Microvirga sp. BSC39]
MKFPRRRSRSSGITSLIIALALAGGAGLVLKPNGRSVEGRAQVTDGDTIRIGEARIRLKGIDAQRWSSAAPGAAAPMPAARRRDGR